MKKYLTKIVLIAPIVFYIIMLISKTSDIEINFSDNLFKYQQIYSKINDYKSVNNFFVDLSKVMKQEIIKSNSVCFVADSTIIGLKQINNEYYIKTMIKLDNNEIIYAYLRCSKKIYKSALKEDYHKSLISIKVNSYRSINKWNFIENIDENIQYEWIEKKYLIKGECIDIIAKKLS